MPCLGPVPQARHAAYRRFTINGPGGSSSRTSWLLTASPLLNALGSRPAISRHPRLLNSFAADRAVAHYRPRRAQLGVSVSDRVLHRLSRHQVLGNSYPNLRRLLQADA